MYRNYDFGYGGAPPPRRRVPVPAFPFRGPLFRSDYAHPFMADPYLGAPHLFHSMSGPMRMRGSYPHPRYIRPGRGGMSHRGAHRGNRQIEKATDKILNQRGGTERSKSDTDAKSVLSSSDTAKKETTKSETESQKAQNSSQDGAANTPQPAIPIGPRIPAKQMWESSYREKVSKKEETASLMPPPRQIKPPNPTTNTANKRKQKKKNSSRGPYFKRKKTTDNNTDSGDGINNRATSDDGATYPRMCKVCNVQIASEEQSKIHKESEIHKQNVNTIPGGDNKTPEKITLEKLNESVPLPTNTPDCLVWEKDTGDRTLNTVRFCRLCSVRMTSLQNAKQHYDGKSHAKRIRIVQRGNRPAWKPFQPTRFVSRGLLPLQKANITDGAYSYSPTFIQAQPQTSQPTSAINLKPALPGDFTNSVTPGGQYYCQTCKIVIDDAGSLNAHLQSKAHKIVKTKS